MTQNQINYAAHLENVRSHVSNEQETKRANQAREFETNRSNLANEQETKRHNLASENETKRHNLFGESIQTQTLEETKRSNRVNESNSKLQAEARYLAAQGSVMSAATSANRLEAEKPLIKAQIGTETQRSINFGSSTALNMQKRNESRANTQNIQARTKTENQQRLPNTIKTWVSVGTEALKGVASGVKLFGG